jgi:undecaprenyl-diphosphatase
MDTLTPNPRAARVFRAPASAFGAPLPRPYFARHPRVGLAVFAACLALFAALTALVKANHPLVSFDLPAAQRIHQWASAQPDALVLFLRFWSSYGRDGVALIALILLVAWLRRAARRELWLLIFGLLGVELLFQVLSNLINRARPEFKDPFETLIGAGYPSGHAATNVFLGLMVLYLLLPRIQAGWKRALLVAAVIAAAALVIFSRIFLGLHYPTDLAAGVLLGTGWAALIFTVTDWYFFRRGRP